MRVGAFAQGLLLKGECSVELVLMCAGALGSSQSLLLWLGYLMCGLLFLTEKPTVSLFNTIAGQLPAKFEVCNAGPPKVFSPEKRDREIWACSN